MGPTLLGTGLGRAKGPARFLQPILQKKKIYIYDELFEEES